MASALSAMVQDTLTRMEGVTTVAVAVQSVNSTQGIAPGARMSNLLSEATYATVHQASLTAATAAPSTSSAAKANIRTRRTTSATLAAKIALIAWTTLVSA